MIETFSFAITIARSSHEHPLSFPFFVEREHSTKEDYKNAHSNSCREDSSMNKDLIVAGKKVFCSAPWHPRYHMLGEVIATRSFYDKMETFAIRWEETGEEETFCHFESYEFGELP